MAPHESDHHHEAGGAPGRAQLALAQFWRRLTVHFWSDEATQLDGEDFQSWALDCGLIKETTYDPAIHGANSVCEAGDPWYEPTPELKAYLKAVLSREDAPSTPSDQQGAPGREEIARIVDPEVFENWDRLYERHLAAGDTAEAATTAADDKHGGGCDDALEKADAILALWAKSDQQGREQVIGELRYEDFYNRAGMMLDHERAKFGRLSGPLQIALHDEHHRRTEAIAEAYAERGEVIDYHDARFAKARSAAQ